MEVLVSSNAANDVPAMAPQFQAMEVQESNAAAHLPATEVHSQVRFPEILNEMIASGSLDFDSWTSLISEIEKAYPDNIESISLVYGSFLSKFPLCHKYWKRFVDHKARLCTVDKVVEVFEQAMQSATHSVDLWIDYCSFSMLAFVDPLNIRRLFERGISFIGKDFLCHTLWDMYIKFEFSEQQWSSLAHIIIRTLKFPTKRLHNYYDNFKKFAAIIEEEIACQENCSLEVESKALPDIAILASEDEIHHVIKELQDPTNVNLRSKALYKYISIGEQFYRKACLLDEKIHCFENHIQRSFFLVKPLDDNQLENWHNYLDFIEKQEDFDWAVKLYERCLIPCANYPEFWMRYVEFMESKGGREIANLALDRATKIFLKNVPEMHLFNARFKEQIGEIDSARSAFLQCDTESNSYFVENAIKEANMEKRLGNLAAASNIYEKALKLAAGRQMLHAVPLLYVRFYRLKYLITGSADVARDVIIDGIQLVPGCRLLLEELIKFAMMHEGSRHLNVVDPIIATAIACGPDGSQGLGSKDREDLSCLYLEYVDLCGTNHDVRKAWNRHIKLFPHLIRTTSSHKHPITSSRQLVSVAMEGRANMVMVDQSRQNDDDNVKESLQQLPFQVVQSGEDAAREIKLTRDLVHQSGDDASGLMELSHDLHQPIEDASGLIESTHDTIHPSQDAASGPSQLTPESEHPGGPITPLEGSPKYSNPISTQQEQEQDHELETDLKPASMESFSLNSQEKESQDLTPTTLENIVPQEISVPYEHPSSAILNHSPAADSAKKQNELDENESGTSSSSASHQNQYQVSAESRGHSQQQASTLERCSTAHMGGKMQDNNRYQESVTQGNITSSSWPVPDVPQQSSVTASQSHLSPQPVYSQPQALISQYPVQSSEQLQAYNQLLQYYYQQQQQYQQQLLQMQQPYLQQQHQQPYQHPLFQQQHSLQQQQQLQQPPYQPQQLQQQQYQLYQQQEQYQQSLQGYQVLVQQYQLQQEQGYQQLLQQHQLQQQLGYQQLQQQDVQLEHQQQITSMQNPRWNRIHDQQGQGITVPCGIATPAASESPHPQQQSPQVTAQPTTAGISRTVVSPLQRQQSPHGVPTAGTSESLHSSLLGHQSPQTQ